MACLGLTNWMLIHAPQLASVPLNRTKLTTPPRGEWRGSALGLQMGSYHPVLSPPGEHVCFLAKE